jgi:hypothetical protein
MQPNAGHPELLMAATQILLPVWQLGVHRTKWHEQTASLFATGPCQTHVRRSDIFVENPVETPGPGLRDAMLAKFRYQRAGFLQRQMPERPLAKRNVSVNETTAWAVGLSLE